MWCVLSQSITGTAVLQIKRIPERPAEYSGRLRLFALTSPWLQQEALRAYLGRFGKVLDCTVVANTCEACVRFATHKTAERARDELCIAEWPAALEYNDRPYDKRGW